MQNIIGDTNINAISHYHTDSNKITNKNYGIGIEDNSLSLFFLAAKAAQFAISLNVR